MAMTITLPLAKDKLLFTPGPLTTSLNVKRAMLRDLGSRDSEFIEIIADVRRRLLELGSVANGEYETILMQGSGTFAIESVIASAIPYDGKLLVIVNGAYGRRMVHIARVLKIECAVLNFAEDTLPDLDQIDAALADDETITHVAVVHCETTTGIINPIKAIGRLADLNHKRYIVDAMSSFGAMPIDLAECSIDYLVSSANKCIEGVPGFAFVLARREALWAAEGYARSLSLDLFAQWRGLENDGQFRFTPPTHALLAFQQALNELDDEDGIEGRAQRYRTNHQVLVEGMRELGFEEYLIPERQGYIITSFRYPRDPKFKFAEFYESLNAKGFVIYPGKVSSADCFRIGTVGRLYESDVRDLLSAIRATLDELEIRLEQTIY
jgi:2-aminoethylphosphonate-pyruvate transaminase